MLRTYWYMIFLMGLLPLPVVAQATEFPRDIRSASAYYPDTENILRSKYEYYFDFWSQQEVRHGRYSRWTRHGVMIFDAYFEEGQLSGSRSFYSPKGIIKRNENWKNGQLHGKTEVFDQKGRLKKLFSYRNGKKDGLSKNFFPSGKLKSATTWRAGVKEGPAVYYDKKGTLIKEKNYPKQKKQKAGTTPSLPKQPTTSLQPNSEAHL